MLSALSVAPVSFVFVDVSANVRSGRNVRFSVRRQNEPKVTLLSLRTMVGHFRLSQFRLNIYFALVWKGLFYLHLLHARPFMRELYEHW